MRPQDAARTTSAAVLTAIHEGRAATVVDSPPGAGKTTLGINIAATASGVLGESVMVACWTNRQAIDFATRAAATYSKVPVTLFMRGDLHLILPSAAYGHPNLEIVSKADEVPNHGIVVSNASKWVAAVLPGRFEWLIVDEAYQLPEYRFRKLAPLANRYVLVGDPGQIAPLIRSDVAPWGCDVDGPHVPSPKVVIERYGITPINLPVSWRLAKDSAGLVRDAFYDFDFESGDPDGLRRLMLSPRNASPSDEVLDSLTSGRSISAAILDEDTISSDVDLELASFIADAAAALFDRNPTVINEVSTKARPLTFGDLGIVTAHRAQVAEVDKRLNERGIPTGEGNVVVETTERWQGLEREVMIVHHPLAGLTSLSSFDLDKGRLCVMLSRHRTACLVVGGAGINAALLNHPHQGERFAGTEDNEWAGWSAHMSVWDQLGASGRVLV